MDDLISRSALIQELEKQCPDWQKTSMGFLIKGAIDDCIQIVKRQPTAYNVDKVIQEIEEFKDMDNREQHCVETKELDKCGDFDDCEQCVLGKAISFVKAGGVNG